MNAITRDAGALNLPVKEFDGGRISPVNVRA